MSRVLGHTRNFQVVLITILFAFLAFGYYKNLLDTAIAVTAICALTILVLLFIFRFDYYHLLLIALIPISVDMVLVGGAKLNFPSEGLLAIAIPVILFFNKSYRTGFSKAILHPITLLIFTWLLIQLITSLLSTHIDVSLKRFVIQLFFVFGFFGIVHMLKEKRKLSSFYFAYAIGLIPVMYFTIKQHIHFNFQPQVVFSICQPYFNDHTVYGACLAFIIPFLVIFLRNATVTSIQSWRKMGLIVLTTLIVASEILALSRAALLSLIVALFFWGLLYYKVAFRKVILGVVILCSTIGVFYEDIYANIEKNEAVSNDGELINHFSSVSNIKSDASNLERINRWICAYRMFEEKPLSGFGPGTYQFEYNRFQTVANKTYISTNSGDRGNAHSEYLSALSEMGLFGGISFVLLVFSSIYYGMQNHYKVMDPLLKKLNLAALLGLITYFFHGIFNAFLDQSKMAFLVFTALALIVWINQYKEDETVSSEVA
jgi:O-antigen ligase